MTKMMMIKFEWAQEVGIWRMGDDPIGPSFVIGGGGDGFVVVVIDDDHPSRKQWCQQLVWCSMW